MCAFSCPKGTKYIFLVFNKIPIFFRFIPRASLVDKVFPVQGAITKISSMDFGPIGSASGMVIIGALPVI